MSVSINNYNNSYSTTQSDSSSTVTRHHHRHHNAVDQQFSKDKETSMDSVQFSPEWMAYTSGSQYSPSSTSNYGADSGDDALTAEQKKTILAKIQSRISAISSSTNDDSASSPLDEVQNEWAGFDASTSTDSQVSDLFDEVMQTLKNSRPPQPPASQSGLPPMMKAMGGILPPFAWGIQGAEASDEQQGNTADSPALTTDQQKSILTDLQTKLDSLSTSLSGPANSGSLTATVSAIKDELSHFEASQATDQEVSDLFDQVSHMFEQARPVSRIS